MIQERTCKVCKKTKFMCQSYSNRRFCDVCAGRVEPFYRYSCEVCGSGGYSLPICTHVTQLHMSARQVRDKQEAESDGD